MARPSRERLLCNPIDLRYRIQRVEGERQAAVFREAADPSIIRFKGRYLLFASMVGGFWHSTDLVTWEFCELPGLPVYDYAPDVTAIDDHVVFSASRRDAPCDFFRTADPLSGEWERILGTIPFWDPALFQDDDGRVYLYEGCAATEPIRGVELDRDTLTPIGEPVAVVESDTRQRGWERVGDDWRPRASGRSWAELMRSGTRPYIEGAWMTKHDGLYYLQYAAPGTEFNGYADGYVVGDSPLGPFRYATDSPFSSKPGGFITGAGHGSTFQDEWGNWWHAATMRISIRHPFERRIGIFPAGFDEQGRLFVNQELGDYPIVVPQESADPFSLTGRHLLVSRGARVTASSAVTGFRADRVVDEDIRTWWEPSPDDLQPWIEVTLDRPTVLSLIQVNLVDLFDRVAPESWSEGEDSPIGLRCWATKSASARFVLEGSRDGSDWRLLAERPVDDRPHQTIICAENEPLRVVRLMVETEGHGAAFGVSGLRVFHAAATDEAAPAEVTRIRRRARNATLRWRAVAGAVAYTVRYGIAPEALTSSYQTTAAELELRSLNRGVDYWFAVDYHTTHGVVRGQPLPLISHRPRRAIAP